MSEEYPELIHCWFSKKQQEEQRNSNPMWFRMDDGTIRPVSETNIEAHGDAAFLRNYPDAEYVGFGSFSHIGESENQS